MSPPVGLNSEKILRRLYPEANRSTNVKLVKAQTAHLLRKQRVDAGATPAWVRKLTLWTLVGTVVAAILALWYYHNVFVAMTSKVAGDWADCEVVMQERHHITVSLARTVIAYSQHERELLTKLTDLRVGVAPLADGSPAHGKAAAVEKAAARGTTPTPTSVAKALEQLGPKQLENLLSHLQIVAEQYPQLKLTENYQQFSRAIVETEHRIAELLIQYNRDVNSYMTVRTQWPGRHFAAILGFAPKEFITVDPEDLKFREATF